MNKIIDGLINLCRWPVALIALSFLPALILSYRYFDFYQKEFYFFGAGIAFFWIIAFTVGSTVRHQIQIIAHELTHTLFALLTLHFVKKIRLNPDGSGGSMQLSGHGNWLIILAPYFFPLFAAIYMLLMPTLLDWTQNHWLIYAVFGYLTAYYWETVLSQVHREQSDIIRCGYLFSAIIIVCFNLFINGAIFAFVRHTWSGFELYCQLVFRLYREFYQPLIELIMPYLSGL
jgi:hypothetical protein